MAGFDLMSLGGALPSAMQGFMQGMDLRQQRDDRKNQKKVNDIMGQMLMGTASQEQEQFLAQNNPQAYSGFQQQRQAQAQQQQAQQQQQVMQQEIMSAINSGDRNIIAQVITKYPQAREAINSAVEIKFPKGGADGVKPAGVLEFDYLTEGLTPEEKQLAKKIDLGLEARTISNAEISAIKNGTIDSYSDYKTEQKQREKFAEATGVSRAKMIDDGFESVNKFNSSIGNIDRAINAIESGAGVGVIDKILPSIRASSVELDNIRNAMALDVVGATTFGALSEGELRLAKDVALPTGLNSPELLDYLARKKVAQEKLRDYYMEQIQFIDQGGTVAGFLRSKERQGTNPVSQPAQATQPTQQSNSVNWSDL